MIDSFKIDHTKLKKGVYVSRIDCLGTEYVTTYDVRVCQPYVDEPMNGAVAHTIEHIVADLLRNSSYGSKVVYFGPMGCMTGFYLIMKGRIPIDEVAALIKRSFSWVILNERIPGATQKECGNYRYHNLEKAKELARRYVECTWEYRYPED